MNDHDEEGLGITSGEPMGRKPGPFSALGLSEMVKKAAFTAIGAAFMTEESVRGYVAESRLPRDVAKYVTQNASQAKEQFFAYLAKEITTLVKKSDLPAVAEKFLRDHTIELEAKIRFRANGAPEVQFGGVKVAPAVPSNGTGAALPVTGAPPSSTPTGACAPPDPASAEPSSS